MVPVGHLEGNQTIRAVSSWVHKPLIMKTRHGSAVAKVYQLPTVNNAAVGSEREARLSVAVGCDYSR